MRRQLRTLDARALEPAPGEDHAPGEVAEAELATLKVAPGEVEARRQLRTVDARALERPPGEAHAPGESF